MSNLRVIIAGGGTGGHIFPAVAIAHAVQRLQPGAELLFVGAEGKMEMEKVPQEGFKIIGLDIAGFNRSNMLKNIWLPIKLLKSAIKAKSILTEFKPDVVVGVGGYASFPMLNAAQRNKVPTVIQEQNSFAGKSNMMLGKKAAAICVAYENMERFFPKEKITVTGNPVREKITQSVVSKAEGQAFFKLDPAKETVLVVGGSLGAKAINEAIDAHLSEIVNTGVQLIWQTGKPYYEQALLRAKDYEQDVKVFDFIKQMDYGYAAADIVISRAGALAIAELCIVAKPVIFVPLPTAAEDHQTSNAMALVNKKAAWLVKNAEAINELVPRLKALIQDTDTQKNMSANLEQLAIKDADVRIANKVIELAGKQ
jgi:UDP-N-acetylglucosamine--N-acetylmuramyl-(pentapeptide) pyrophosphoryl-undecaprenol N-acetylglucosamine transferase